MIMKNVNIKDVIINTLELSGDNEKKAYWMINETLPFNTFSKMVEQREQDLDITIAISSMDLVLFEQREKKFALLN